MDEFWSPPGATERPLQPEGSWCTLCQGRSGVVVFITSSPGTGMEILSPMDRALPSGEVHFRGCVLPPTHCEPQVSSNLAQAMHQWNYSTFALSWRYKNRE